MVAQFNEASKAILSELVQTIDITSAWILKARHSHKVFVVVGEYMADRARVLERISDLFNEYPMQDYDYTYKWFTGDPTQPLILQIDDFPFMDLEVREYRVENVKTVVNVAIFHEDQTWGYMELWESRHRWEVSESDLESAREAAQKIAALLDDDA